MKSEIIAFLNSEGGTIYIGIEDDGSILGIRDEHTKEEMDLKPGMIEPFGTGIPRTIESYKGYDAKPNLRHLKIPFSVTLSNLNYQANESINVLGSGVLKTIQKYPGISIPEMVLEL